jgi:hypothetical protein
VQIGTWQCFVGFMSLDVYATNLSRFEKMQILILLNLDRLFENKK